MHETAGDGHLGDELPTLGVEDLCRTLGAAVRFLVGRGLITDRVASIKGADAGPGVPRGISMRRSIFIVAASQVQTVLSLP